MKRGLIKDKFNYILFLVTQQNADLSFGVDVGIDTGGDGSGIGPLEAKGE